MGVKPVSARARASASKPSQGPGARKPSASKADKKRRTVRMSTRARERTASKRSRFLKALADGASQSAAAAAAGVSRRTPYKWRDTDAAFAEDWDEAEATGTDRIEDAAMRRAVDGVKRPVFQQGKCVGHVTEYSDHLTAILLKGRRPEKFRENIKADLAVSTPQRFYGLEGDQLDLEVARSLAYLLEKGSAAADRLSIPRLPAPTSAPGADLSAERPSVEPLRDEPAESASTHTSTHESPTEESSPVVLQDDADVYRSHQAEAAAHGRGAVTFLPAFRSRVRTWRR